MVVTSFSYLIDGGSCGSESVDDLCKVEELIKAEPGLEFGALNSRSRIFLYCLNI